MNAVLRSFSTPLLILFTSAAYAFELVAIGYSRLDTYQVIFIIFLLVFGTPLFLVVTDLLARLPLKPVSNFLAFVYGSIWQLVFAVIFSLICVGLILIPIEIWLYFSGEVTSDWAIYQSYERTTDGGDLLLRIATISSIAAIFCWLVLRAIKIEWALSQSTSRSILLGSVARQGVWSRISYILGLPASHWRLSSLFSPSFWLMIAARSLVYISIFSSAVTLANINSTTSTTGWVVGIPIVLFLSGHYLFAIAKRLASSRIWKNEKSGRQTILFLRSFEDDQFSVKRPWYDLVGRWLELWSFRQNVDEILIDEVAQHRQVIALGQPGERVAPFGADRRYVDHEGWKQVVEHAASEAEIIVVGTGDTPGLIWEYELILNRGYLDKTIFLFPPDPVQRQSACDLFLQVFSIFNLSKLDVDRLVAIQGDTAQPEKFVSRHLCAQAYTVALRDFLFRVERERGNSVEDNWRSFSSIIARVIGFSGLFVSIFYVLFFLVFV